VKENSLKVLPGALLSFILAFPAAFAAPTPGLAANRIFLFASPNTHESLTDDEAKTHLTSFEQINATAVADRAACSLTRSVQIANSLGIYDISSENSFILESDLNQKNSEYLAALLGLYSRQEFILLFLDEASGGDRLWVIKTPQSLDTVIATLRKINLIPVTVRARKDHNEIWYTDRGEKHTQALKKLASDVNGQASIEAGIAEMPGNNDRATAVKEWRQQIRAFEQNNGRHLSAQLSSENWRGATAIHTCSTEISIP
jgi:hypothetical protein